PVILIVLLAVRAAAQRWPSQTPAPPARIHEEHLLETDAHCADCVEEQVNPPMHITDAQRENRFRYSGGFYGQAVAGLIWLVSAGFALWSSPRTAIALLVIGGFFIFPITELLVRTVGSRLKLDSRNSLPQLGMQVAFVLPLSMPLLLPISQY